MVDNDDSPAPSRLRHIVRLVVFAAVVLGLFYLVAVVRVIDLLSSPEKLRARLDRPFNVEELTADLKNERFLAAHP